MAKKGVKTPDIMKLREAYQASPVAKAAFDNFAARQKNRAEMAVDQLYWQLRQEVPSASRGDVIHLLKFLETSGCGQFLVGRRGQPSRFRWSVSLIEAGMAAAGETFQVEKLSVLEGSDEAEDAISDQLIEHRSCGLEWRFGSICRPICRSARRTALPIS